jgi:hypothetical protein
MFTFLIIILFIALVCWIGFKLALYRIASKMKKNSEDNNNTVQSPTKKKIVNKDIGEYVDYETVKEDKNGNI